MFKRILVPTDGSEISQSAVRQAVALAHALGARVYALSVRDPFPFAAVSEFQIAAPSEFIEAQERMATTRVQQVAAACAAAGVECETHTVEASHPWEGIIDSARRHECDLIVMASHGRRGIGALLLGSVTQKVLTHTLTPVLVVR